MATRRIAKIALWLASVATPWGAAGAQVLASDVGQPDVAEDAGPSATSRSELLALSLEELLASEVTSVAKKPQMASQSAGSVYVISQEDISRSGARQLSDLFRMVPGLDVVEVTPSITSVTARGFSSAYSVNMLVMIDGAAIYSSSIAGMFWDQALVPLQDIERIEVIRGPGGPLWGSNATNGIINIITRQSVDTQGLRANAKAGAGILRAELGYGRQLSDTLGMRLYGDYRYERGLDAVDGHSFDDWRKGGLVGARLDFAPDTVNSVVALGEFSRSDFVDPTNVLGVGPGGAFVQVVTPQQRYTGYHVLGRWHHVPTASFDLSVQAYFNRYERSVWGSQIARNLVDVSVEGRWRATNTHEFNFGLTARQSDDDMTTGPMLTLFDGHHTDRWLTGYVQDEIRLQGDNLRLTLGSKFEINTFMPLIVQPSARLFWRASPALSLWGGISHAVRTPQLRERDMTANFPSLYTIPGSGMVVPMVLIFSGGADAKSEQVTAFEAGLRAPLGRLWAVDLSLFYNHYTHLNTNDMTGMFMPGTPGSPNPMAMVITTQISDRASGFSHGGELLIKGQPLPAWKTELSWSYIDLAIRVDPAYAATTQSLLSDNATARHQLRWKNGIDLSDAVNVDSLVHYVSRSKDGLRAPYTDMDLRVAWRPWPNLELAAVGNNLLKARHLEYVQTMLPFPMVTVPRKIYVEAKVRF